MTADEAKAALARAVKRAWPNLAKASELPFPDYWKKQTEWLCFHAPRIGKKLMEEFVIAIIEKAKDAESRGLTPEPWIVPDKVKAIWANVDKAEHSSAIRTGAAKTEEKREAWDHAAERAAEVKNRFTTPFSGPRPSSFRQGSLGSW